MAERDEDQVICSWGVIDDEGNLEQGSEVTELTEADLRRFIREIWELCGNDES